LKELYALDKGINGTVYVRFIVNCRGEAVDHKILRGLDEETDRLVIEKLKSLQAWTPGRQRKRIIDCYYSIVIRLKKGRFK
jgi:protein TonB